MHFEFQQHAMLCGIDMIGRRALPVAECADRISALDVFDPETMEIIIPEGFKVTQKGVDYLVACGCDYIVVEDT
jgi:hypothetical protein